MLLRLVLEGENIFPVCLAQSTFELGFPFGQPEIATVKKIPMGNQVEKLVIEQAMTR